jgi:hypothetical protein
MGKINRRAIWPITSTSTPGSNAIAVMFATFMEVLDTTVVNVSPPHRRQPVGDD